MRRILHSNRDVTASNHHTISPTGRSERSLHGYADRVWRPYTVHLESCFRKSASRAQPVHGWLAIWNPHYSGRLYVHGNGSGLRTPPSLANASLSITINPALQVTTTSLPNGSPDVPYSGTLATTGGIAPYTWAITQGSLPNGLTLNATSGVISGMPANSGMSTFTVQVSDSEVPAATATASLSIAINLPPPRNAALYTSFVFGNPPVNQAGLQIHSDGSLTVLPSSPETAITGSDLAASPTLPLLFTSSDSSVQSLLINPDYSISSISSASLPQSQGAVFGAPSVDPTGANLYLPGVINSSGATGVIIFPANGSLQTLSTVAITGTNLSSSRLVFTPDGKQAFIASCPNSGEVGSILSFLRNSDGTLTQTATTATTGNCGDTLEALAVSADGGFLATAEVQVYSIAGNGTLTPLLSQPFTVTINGINLNVPDLTWDSTGSYLLAATSVVIDPPLVFGGVAVLSFSGNTLTETVPPGGRASNASSGSGLLCMPWAYAFANVVRRVSWDLFFKMAN